MVLGPVHPPFPLTEEPAGHTRHVLFTQIRCRRSATTAVRGFCNGCLSAERKLRFSFVSVRMGRLSGSAPVLVCTNCRISSRDFPVFIICWTCLPVSWSSVTDSVLLLKAGIPLERDNSEPGLRREPVPMPPPRDTEPVELPEPWETKLPELWLPAAEAELPKL